MYFLEINLGIILSISLSIYLSIIYLSCFTVYLNLYYTNDFLKIQKSFKNIDCLPSPIISYVTDIVCIVFIYIVNNTWQYYNFCFKKSHLFENTQEEKYRLLYLFRYISFLMFAI